MRILSFIMAGLIVLLLAAPVCSGFPANEDKCCTETSCGNDEMPAAKDCANDICNPFLCQACCTKFTSTLKLPFQKEKVIARWEIPASVQICSLFEADFWQPPKLG